MNGTVMLSSALQHKGGDFHQREGIIRTHGQILTDWLVDYCVLLSVEGWGAGVRLNTALEKKLYYLLVELGFLELGFPPTLRIFRIMLLCGFKTINIFVQSYHYYHHNNTTLSC